MPKGRRMEQILTNSLKPGKEQGQSSLEIEKVIPAYVVTKIRQSGG